MFFGLLLNSVVFVLRFLFVPIRLHGPELWPTTELQVMLNLKENVKVFRKQIGTTNRENKFGDNSAVGLWSAMFHGFLHSSFLLRRFPYNNLKQITPNASPYSPAVEENK